MTRGARVSVGAIATAIVLVACNGLIGEKDIFFAPGDDDSGVGANDGAPFDSGDQDVTQPTDGGACGDTTISSTNCGTCGHDCLGGGCLASQCQPLTLVTGVSPRHVAVDAAHVYWVDSAGDHVGQVDKDGKNGIDLAVAGPSNSYPIGVAVDDTSVYWGGIEDVLFRCKIGGCGNAPTKVSTTSPFNDLVVDATSVFWLDGDTDGKILSVPKTTANGTGSLIASAPSGTVFNRLAADATYLYATNDDGKVRRIAKTGGTVAVLATAVSTTLGIAVDNTNVYFTDGDDPGAIDKVVKTGTSVNATPFVGALHHPTAIASDGASIYWVNAYTSLGTPDGTVMTCKVTDCSAPTVLAIKQRSPVAIAIDATAVYWASFDNGNGNGSVQKLAKP